MSNTVRIALVGEGVTDFEVLKAGIDSMLNGRSFDLKLLQPEESLAFTAAGAAGSLGGGWRGVYKWCLQAALRGDGVLSGDPLFISYDLLIIHLDADVASENSEGDIPDLAGMLPCGPVLPLAQRLRHFERSSCHGWERRRHLPEQFFVRHRKARNRGSWPRFFQPTKK